MKLHGECQTCLDPALTRRETASRRVSPVLANASVAAQMVKRASAITALLLPLIGASLMPQPAFAQVKVYRDETPAADQAIANQDWLKAIAELDTRIAANPRDVQARFKRATALARAGRDDDAIAALTQITQTYPELPEPYNNLAALYAKHGRFELARRTLETALAANPNFALARRNLGDVYLHLAADAYQQSVRENPSDHVAASRSKDIAAIVDVTPATGMPSSVTQHGTVAANASPTRHIPTANEHEFQPSLGGQPPTIAPGVYGNATTLSN